jgi:hypothetical protein
MVNGFLWTPAKGISIMFRRVTHFGVFLICVGVLTSWGCLNRPSRLRPPEIDASEAGTMAVEKYDTNGDGLIGGDELDKAPELKTSLKTIDENGDGSISADEITARIQEWQETGTARMPVNCTVRFNGQPLEGATVTFEPLDYLGGNLPTATGQTNQFGIASLQAQDDLNLPGVAPGFYRVRITKQGEDIPAKYNTETILGQEVGYGVPNLMAGNVTINLE